MHANSTLSAAPSDRREAVRAYAGGRPIWIESKSGESGEAQLIDVSRTGIRFRTAIDLQIGTEVVVNPPAESGLAALRTRIARRIVMNDGGEGVEYGAAYADTADSNRHAWFIKLRAAA